jgi:hypothetical protein
MQSETKAIGAYIAGTISGTVLTILCLGLMAGCVTRAEPYELALDASDIERIKWEARR